MYEKLEKCPSCGHLKFHNHLICKDHSVSDESFALVKCGNCELIFTNPRPEETELGKYYKSDDYISHTDKGNSLINLIYKLVRTFTLRKKRRLIQSLVKTGTILDYGCGTGDFLKECQKNGWETFGVEPDEEANKIATSKLGVPITGKLSKVPTENKFHIITAWHVLEHVSQLQETLKKLRKKIKKDGYILIAVPNPSSLDASIYKEHWAAYDVPRHLYHFTPASFTFLAKKMKLKLVKTLPMKYDSYYVSLLSEKNMNGRTNFWNGFRNGFKSNRAATKSGNYSSLIYILKK